MSKETLSVARLRTSGYETSRRAILEKAVAAFAAKGYASASMSDLANACDMSKATLYHYFDSKESLLFEALDSYTADLIELAKSSVSPNASSKEQLVSLIQNFLLTYQSARDLHVSLLNDVKFLSIEQQLKIKTQERQVIDVFATVISAAFPDKVSDANRFALTMSLLGTLNFTFAWLKDSGPVSYSQYGNWVSELWLEGLKNGNFPTLQPTLN